MDTLLLVRHAEAAGSDVADPVLSAVGRAQARALADALHIDGVDEVWHSPRRRARETAGVVARTADASTRCTELLDDLTPVPSASHWEAYPAAAWPWLRAVPAAERDEDGATLTAAWSALRQQAEGRGRVVLITHAFVAAWFISRELEASTAAWMRLTVSPTGITEIVPTSIGSTLRRIDDTRHAGGLTG